MYPRRLRNTAANDGFENGPMRLFGVTFDELRVAPGWVWKFDLLDKIAKLLPLRRPIVESRTLQHL